MANEHKTLAVASGALIIFLVGLVLKLAKPVFFPFFLAIFFYFILSPALDLLTRLKIPKVIALSLLVLLAFLSLYFLGALIFSRAKGFVASFPQYGEKIGQLLEWVSKKLGREINETPWFWLQNFDLNRVAPLLLSSLNQFLSFFSRLVLIFVFLIFMLAGRGKLAVKIERSFSTARSRTLIAVIDKIDAQVQKYLVIKTGVSAISGLITGTVLALFGVNYALIFGFLTFLLNFIPSLGSIIAISFSTLMAVFQFGRFFPALWILAILVIADILTANLIEPKLMGQGLNLSPLAVLFSLLFWAWLWGIPGMILAVPLLAIVKIIFDNIPSLRFIAELISK